MRFLSTVTPIMEGVMNKFFGLIASAMMALALAAFLVGGTVRGRVHARALEGRGEEGAAVVLRAAQRDGRGDGEIAGQVLVLRAKAVECPRAERGAHEARAAGVKLHEGLGVVRNVRVHAAQEAHFIGVLGDLREGFRNPQAALAALLELRDGRHELALVTRLASVGNQLGLVVEGVEVRRPALHGEEDDALGARREMRLLGCERLVHHGPRRERGEGQPAEAAGDGGERGAARPLGGKLLAREGGGRIHTDAMG